MIPASERRARRALSMGMAIGMAIGMATSPAWAQPTSVDRENARALWRDGRAKMDAGDARGALASFLAAHAIMNAPTTGVELAKARAALGQLIEARDVALQVKRMPVEAGEPAPYGRARAEAAELADRLALRVPAVQVTVRGLPAAAEARVEIDGAALPPSAVAVPWRVNPGAHRITVQAPGFRAEKREVTIAEGQTQVIDVALVPDRAPTPVAPAPSASADLAPAKVAPAKVAPAEISTRKILGVTGLVLGGAGLVAGAVFGGLVIARHGELVPRCPGGVCPPEQAGALRAYHTLSAVSTLGFVAGGVLAATGAVVLVVSRDPAPPRAVSVTPYLRAGQVGMEGFW